MDSAFHLVRGSRKVLTNADWRRYLAARTLTRTLSKVNPDVRYLGLVEGGEVTFLHLADSMITPWVIAVGHFQRKDFEMAWRECQRLAPRPPGGVFVDVGANVGTTTLYALRTGDFTRAVCIEPSPNNLDVLRLNVLTNKLTGMVEVIAAACSAREGTANLWLTSGNQGDHRLARKAPPPKTHESVIEVETMSLDHALRSVDVKPSDVSMVWVDTQGHELEVLIGAADVIAAAIPFCMEFWPAQYSEAGNLNSILHLIQDCFASYLEVGDVDLRVRPVGDLPVLAERLLQTGGQIDIILLPAVAG